MTTPEHLPPAPRSRPASPVVAYAGIPLGSLLVVVLLAWLHKALGEPLGPGWGAELWTAIKTGALVITPVYVGVAHGVQKHNARVEAIYAAHRALAESQRVTYDSPAESLMDGRRLTPTGSHPALPTRAFVVVDRSARPGHPDGEEE